MANLPIVYRKTPENIIASYTFTDLIEGTGGVVFYGFVSNDGTDDDYHLTTQQPYTNKIEVSATDAALTGSYKDIINVDFDLTAFILPQTIKGTGLIENFFHYDDPLGSGGWSVRLTYRLQKWDGTTETTIATHQVILTTPSATDHAVVAPLGITQTTFRTGDVLRLNVQAEALGSSRDANNFTIGTDPKNRDGTYIVPSADDLEFTQLKLTIPFKIDA